MSTHHSKTMKTNDERNTSKIISMTFLNENRPKGKGKYQRALLRLMEKAVHNGCGTATAMAPPRYMKQRNQRSRLRMEKAGCNQIEQKKPGHGVTPRYREQQTHPHKKYNQRKNGKNGNNSDSKVYLKELSTSSDMAMKYMHFDWGEEFEIKVPNNASKTEIGSFRDLCADLRATDTKTNITAFDESTNHLLFSKICHNQSSHCLRGKKGLNENRRWIQMAMEKKPDVARGAKTSGCDDAYKIFGIRKEPLGCGVGTYSFKEGVSNDDKEQLNSWAEKMCNRLESATKPVEEKLVEADTMFTLVDCMEHEGMGEGVVATALSIGRNYWSQAHVDKDFYFTRLTVLAPEDLPHEHFHGKVLYYFVFPTYKIRIPLKSGDVLFFNPLILHSCSNPRYKDSYIMSAYVSTKTVLCRASGKNE